MVVANPVLEARSGPGRLNPPDEAFGDQEPEGVVHGLERDGPDLGPDELCHALGADVGLSGDCAQDCQALGRDVNAALAKEICRLSCHSD